MNQRQAAYTMENAFETTLERMLPMEHTCYPFSLPSLPYAYDALLPQLDEKTLHFHHDKHFAAYVDALNRLLENRPALQSWTLERLCRDWADLPDDIRQGVRNNAGRRLEPRSVLPHHAPHARLLAGMALCCAPSSGISAARTS